MGFNPDLSTSNGKKGRAFSQFSPKSMTLKRESVVQVTCLDLKAGEKKGHDEARGQTLKKLCGQQLSS